MLGQHPFYEQLTHQIESLKRDGLYKHERVLTSSQSAHIVAEGRKLLNMCANNYLGLANHPSLVKAAQQSLDQYGYGVASVRFICGTQDVHKTLEAKISSFLKTDDTILYSSCFDANGGLFETLLGEDDAIISDELNHASIIDGIRLCKAKRFRYKNNDMADLQKQLNNAEGCRVKMIATDGVFSMDGVVANLADIVTLAKEHDALLMVDDSHAVGVVGKNGRGSLEFCGVEGEVDIVTGTLGKALGGASGGYTTGKNQIIEWLRQRSRPYLFSNSLVPMIASTTLTALDLLRVEGQALVEKLSGNAQYFREQLTSLGFQLTGAGHPIIPVMLGDAILAKNFADELLKEGVYAIGFSFPVVPHGKARIRTQMSAAHTRSDLDFAVKAFKNVSAKNLRLGGGT